MVLRRRRRTTVVSSISILLLLVTLPSNEGFQIGSNTNRRGGGTIARLSEAFLYRDLDSIDRQQEVTLRHDGGGNDDVRHHDKSNNNIDQGTTTRRKVTTTTTSTSPTKYTITKQQQQQHRRKGPTITKYKHVYRYCTDISVDCWLATINPSDFFSSCGYTKEEIQDYLGTENVVAENNPLPIVRNQFAPKIRFLVRTLGGGYGNICCGDTHHKQDCNHHDDDDENNNDDNNDCYIPHNLRVSDVTKRLVPMGQFLTNNKCRLDRIVAPRHAYLTLCPDLPSGKDLITNDNNDGHLIQEFLQTCEKSTSEFAALCNRWSSSSSSSSSSSQQRQHTVEQIEAFERIFHRGLLPLAKNNERNVFSSSSFFDYWHHDPNNDIVDNNEILSQFINADKTADLLECTSGKFMEILLQHGANPIENDKCGTSLLHWAAGTGNAEGTEALLRTLIDIKDGGTNNAGEIIMYKSAPKDGATPLHWACCGVRNKVFGVGGHTETCRILLEYATRTTMDATDDDDDDNVVDLLNTATYEGHTPLMWAVWGGNLDVVKLLISYHADVQKKSNDGSTVAHWAAFGGHLSICQYLYEIQDGDTISFLYQTNDEGYTPLDIAKIYGHDDIVEWITSLLSSSSSNNSQQ